MTNPLLAILIAQATPNTLDTSSWVLVVLIVGWLLSTAVTIITLLEKRTASVRDRAGKAEREALLATINGNYATLIAKFDALNDQFAELRKRDDYYEKNFRELRESDRRIELDVVSRLAKFEQMIVNLNKAKEAHGD